MYNPKAKHSCSVVGCTDPHVSLRRLPTKEHHQLDSTPPPPPRQSQPGLDWPSGIPGNARGADAHFWAGPPPPSVVGRDGLAIGRFGRFPKPPAVILYLRPPPPRQQSRSPPPPPPVNNRDHPPHPRRRSVLWLPGPNLVPSPALVTTLTPAKNTHRRLTLTPARTYKVAPQFVVRQPFLPQTQVLPYMTPSSRLPPAGRSGRCKYRLWAGHGVAH